MSGKTNHVFISQNEAIRAVLPPQRKQGTTCKHRTKCLR